MKSQLLIMAIHDIGTAPNPTLRTMLMSLISWIAYPVKHVLVVLTVHKKYQISRHPLVILPLLSHSLCVCICAFILRCLLLNIIFQFASGFLRVKILQQKQFVTTWKFYEHCVCFVCAFYRWHYILSSRRVLFI